MTMVKGYTRRTKSGKTVRVKAHSRKYIKHGQTVKSVNYQTGRQKVAGMIQDSKITAMKSGRRVSRTGRHYTETRKNRSDLNRKKRL